MAAAGAVGPEISNSNLKFNGKACGRLGGCSRDPSLNPELRFANSNLTEKVPGGLVSAAGVLLCRRLLFLGRYASNVRRPMIGCGLLLAICV